MFIFLRILTTFESSYMLSNDCIGPIRTKH